MRLISEFLEGFAADEVVIKLNVTSITEIPRSLVVVFDIGGHETAAE